MKVLKVIGWALMAVVAICVLAILGAGAIAATAVSALAVLGLVVVVLIAGAIEEYFEVRRRRKRRPSTG